MTGKPRHALVLGASGFLGSAVVRRLASEGYQLTVLIHRRKPEWLPESAHVISGTLRTLRDIPGPPPDVVFHCARLRGRSRWGRYLAAWRGQFYNRRLIRILGSTPMIYASGSLMYGDCGNRPVYEDAALHPTSYAREYILAERPLRDAIMFRPGWILGPGSWLEWFYLQPAEASGAVPRYGPGTNLMSVIHRDDCAAAMTRLGDNPQPGVYHPPSLPVITQREFVQQLADELKLPIREERLDTKERAVREAFTTSINLRSSHGQVWFRFQPQFTDLRSALQDVLAARKARIHRNASKG